MPDKYEAQSQPLWFLIFSRPPLHLEFPIIQIETDFTVLVVSFFFKGIRGYLNNHENQVESVLSLLPFLYLAPFIYLFLLLLFFSFLAPFK